MTSDAREYGERNRLAGVYLKAKREAKGLTREQVAQALSIGEETMSRIEAGRARLSLDRLIDICAVLDISPVVMVAVIMRMTADVPRETSTSGGT